MGNRVIAAKLLKMKKRKRNAARAMPRYNPLSPFALKTRKFDAPDSSVMERDVSGSIDGRVSMVDSRPAQFNSDVMAAVHLNMKSETDVLVMDWSNWKRSGQTYFVRMNVIERRDLVLDLWFYGRHVYWIAFDYRERLAKRSMNYQTISRAKLELDHNSIRWVEEIPIESS